MITRRSLLAGAALGLTAPRHQPPPPLPPRVYLGLSKDIGLGGSARIQAFYQCNLAPVPCAGPRPTVNMEKFLLAMQGQFVSHSPCDEITESGFFAFKWNCLVRADVNSAGGFTIFGTHAGTFAYKDTCGNIASGTMDGTINCGTHRAPTSETCEVCRLTNQFEGLLKGKFTSGPLATMYASLGGAQMVATYFGDINPGWPVPGTNPSLAADMALDGVYIVSC